MIIGIIGALFSGGSFLLQVKEEIDEAKREKFLTELMKKGINYLEICKHFHSFYQEFYFYKWLSYYNGYKKFNENVKCKEWEALYNNFYEMREKSGVASDVEILSKNGVEEINDSTIEKIIEKLGLSNHVTRFSTAFSKILKVDSEVDAHFSEYNNIYEERKVFNSDLHKNIERGLRSLQVNSDIGLKRLISILFTSLHRY